MTVHYKQIEIMEHDQFVLTTTGTTFTDAFLMISLNVLSGLIHLSLCKCSLLIARLRQQFRFQVLFDGFFLCLFPVFVSLILSDYIIWIVVLSCILISLVLAVNVPSCSEVVRIKDESAGRLRFAFMETSRFYIVFPTAFYILAVDFPLLERRYVKTRMYGVSVMDAGVGLFVALSAYASKFGVRQISLKSIFRGSAYLFVMGLIRLVTVKQSEYPETVLEYGQHWNFFFTLAFTRLLGGVIYAIFPAYLDWIIGCAIMIIYQYLLKYTAFGEILDNEDRSNLVLANKEGIASLAGYLVMHQCFAAYARLVMYNKVRSTFSEWRNFILVTLLGGVALIMVSTVLHYEVGLLVSRRLANLPYATWTMGVAFVCLSLATVESLMEFMYSSGGDITTLRVPSDSARYLIRSSVSRHAFAYFLFSNLLTGAVNLVMDTKSQSNTVAALVLATYVCTGVAFCLVLDWYQDYRQKEVSLIRRKIE